MLGWMCYVIVVSILLGLAALAFERSARLRKAQTRWLWVACMAASLLIPLAVSSISLQIPQLVPVAGREAPATTIALRRMTTPEFSPSTWLVAGAGPAVASPRLDNWLRGGWLVTSLGLLAVISWSSVRLHRRRRGWVQDRMAGVAVYVSEDIGPAIVGLRKPHIVVPRWLATAPPEQQTLVIAHEQAHLDGRDAQLLMVALCMLVCIPWNIPLWFHFRRLRLAIEVDCDARVLARGHDVRRYGEALIAVGERQSGTMTVVAAMSESKSLLEHRISNMLRKKTKWTWTTATALACLGLSFVAVAAQVSPPDASKPTVDLAKGNVVANPGRQEVTLDAAVLDRYAGFYQLNDNAVLTVTRNGGQLMSQLTGQPALPIFAEAGNRFVARLVNASFTFVADADRPATAVILQQGGGHVSMPRIETAMAEQIQARTAERLKNQTANPRSEAAIGRYIAGIVSGKPNYDEMTTSLADLTRQQLSQAQSWLTKMGEVKSITFIGVGAQGEDVYNVRHEGGASSWRIGLDANGIIALAAVRRGA